MGNKIKNWFSIIEIQPATKISGEETSIDSGSKTVLIDKDQCPIREDSEDAQEFLDQKN